MINSISTYKSNYLAIYKTKNGLVVIDHAVKEFADKTERQIQEEYVFRNKEELCEWISQYYQEKP